MGSINIDFRYVTLLYILLNVRTRAPFLCRVVPQELVNLFHVKPANTPRIRAGDKRSRMIAMKERWNKPGLLPNVLQRPDDRTCYLWGHIGEQHDLVPVSIPSRGNSIVIIIRLHDLFFYITDFTIRIAAQCWPQESAAERSINQFLLTLRPALHADTRKE